MRNLIAVVVAAIALVVAGSAMAASYGVGTAQTYATVGALLGAVTLASGDEIVVYGDVVETATATISANNITIRGATGPGTDMLRAAASIYPSGVDFPLISGTGANLTVKNLDLKGNGSYYGGRTGTVVNFSGNGMTLDNTRLYSSYGYSSYGGWSHLVAMSGASGDVAIKNSVLTSGVQYQHNYVAGQTSGKLLLENNLFTDVNPALSDDGGRYRDAIGARGLSGTTIRYNIFKNVSSGSIFRWEDSSGSSAPQVTYEIHNNLFYNTLSNTPYLQAANYISGGTWKYNNNILVGIGGSTNPQGWTAKDALIYSPLYYSQWNKSNWEIGYNDLYNCSTLQLWNQNQSIFLSVPGSGTGMNNYSATAAGNVTGNPLLVLVGGVPTGHATASFLIDAGNPAMSGGDFVYKTIDWDSMVGARLLSPDIGIHEIPVLLPEPASLALIGLGLGALAIRRRT